MRYQMRREVAKTTAYRIPKGGVSKFRENLVDLQHKGHVTDFVGVRGDRSGKHYNVVVTGHPDAHKQLEGLGIHVDKKDA